MPTRQTDNLMTLLGAHYGLHEPAIELIRSHTNDVYRVQTGEQIFALKIYGPKWRRDSEILFEIDLLDYLARNDIRVATSIRDRRGAALQHVMTADGDRQAVLFGFAEGEKAVMPASIDLYHAEGKAAAALHNAADGFQSRHDRHPLSLTYLIGRPLALVESLPVSTTIKRDLTKCAEGIRSGVEECVDAGLDWGICHGDLTYDNFHLTAEGETIWFDFDSGGFGWRAIDLQGWVTSAPEYFDRWCAFLTGYAEVRPLRAQDVAAAPYVYYAQEIWGIEVELRYRVLHQGAEAAAAFLQQAVDHLRPWRENVDATLAMLGATRSMVSITDSEMSGGIGWHGNVDR
jgi:Ser/Thr protein kinase RdoA (MazF antagonist)